MSTVMTPEQLKAFFVRQAQQPDRGAVMRDLLRQPMPKPQPPKEKPHGSK
jgi:hypothetical protein